MDYEVFYRQSLIIINKLYCNGQPAVGDVLNNLGLVYYDQGQYSAAEFMYRQALEIYKKYFGNFHPNVA
ncbi:MAG: tetratricopeptide repeat protein, partial [Saccharolobus sp.]